MERHSWASIDAQPQSAAQCSSALHDHSVNPYACDRMSSVLLLSDSAIPLK